jgi:hypothetical protein
VSISAIAVAWTAATVVLSRKDQYVQDLYGWWFVPFFFALAGLYVCLVAAAQVVLLRVDPAPG